MSGSEAVVIGASLAGLSVAAALADHFQRVTVVERDSLPQEPANRKGVPQDRHLHLLLPGGATALDELLPGILDEMEAAGALRGDADLIRISLNGHRLARAAIGQRAVFATRPFVEAHVRRRVVGLSSVAVRDEQTVSALVVEEPGRVNGVRLSEDEGEYLPADLVVDCSGRGSRTPAWLEELGYGAPPVERLDVDVQYVTRTVELSSDALDGDLHVLVGPTADSPRGGAMTHVGRDRWLVTLFTMAGADVLPESAEEFRAFAARLPIPDIHDAVSAASSVGAGERYRFRANQRRRYDRSASLPHGLLVAGDAVCSFNPIYGQGMSVAALEAVTLRRSLGGGAPPTPAQWFRAIDPIIDDAWELAVAADLSVDRIEGERSLRVRFANAYTRWLHAAAATDPALTGRFVRVAGLIDPPTALLRPAAVARVVRGRVRHWLTRDR